MIKEITREFNEVANKYTQEVYDLWGYFEGYEYPTTYWVGNEIGGILEIGDLFISFDELRYIVDNSIKHSEYLKYYDYCYRISCLNMDRGKLNIKSWFQGAPRISEEELSKLEAAQEAIRQLQEDLDKQIKEARF